MKTSIFLVIIFLVSCSDNINMTLVCDLTESPNREKSIIDGWIDDRDFIWYKSNNSLQSSYGNVTPYIRESDFKIIFERYDIHDENIEERNPLKLKNKQRSIEYYKLSNKLKLTEYLDGKIRVFMEYDCKRLN